MPCSARAPNSLVAFPISLVVFESVLTNPSIISAANIKGQKICPSCEREVDINVSFCPYCGTPCPTPEPAKDVEGDTVSSEEDSEDGSCGTEKAQEEVQPEEPKTEESAEASSAQEQPVEESTVEEETVEEPEAEKVTEEDTDK